MRLNRSPHSILPGDTVNTCDGIGIVHDVEGDGPMDGVEVHYEDKRIGLNGIRIHPRKEVARADASPRVLSALRTFRAIILDADGVWFDGKETRGRSDQYTAGAAAVYHSVSKTRDLRDGQGLSFLRALGIRVLFASGEGEPLDSCVAKLNALPSCVSGKWAHVEVATDLRRGKVGACEAWITEGARVPVISALWSNVIYVGDDRTDLEAMRACAAGGGLVVVPSDAQRVARRLAHLVLTKPGGGGAIRELAELACDARGVDEATLEVA